MTTTKILPIDAADIREMHESGIPIREIAQRMGISRSAARDHALGRRTARIPKWMVIQSDVAALKANGLKVKEMARHLGVSAETVLRALDERHLKRLNQQWSRNWHARRAAETDART